MKSIDFHRRVMEIFDQVCDLPRPEQIERIAALTDGNEELRAKIEGMLDQDQVGDVTEVAAVADQLVATLHADAKEELPAQIGAYRVLRKIGQGGMGVIFEAEQESPARCVALKLLSPDMLGSEGLRRFRRETHVLGQLQHPGIGQIYDAGVAKVHGRQCPFFAMELIEGLPLTQHATEARLSTRQNLELLARVCDAVQYAHQKSIIHRDLKPANVLVVSQPVAGAGSGTAMDTIGMPKVLDFGIARVVEGDMPHVTLQTEIGQVMGTLAYMSPEQVRGDTQDLDTRCDVYSLGVMLYELLAGARPHDLSGLSIPEAARHVQEVDPPLLGSHDAALRGDVETIAARAMEKDRERRYGAAADLAADIRRYLNNEPIEARPATTLYLIGKFARRNRALVAGLGATFVMLIVALSTTAYGLIQAESRRVAAVRSNEQLQRVVDYQAAMLTRLDVEEMGQVLTAQLRGELRAVASDEQWETVDSVLSRFAATTTASRLLDASIMRPAAETLDADFTDQPQLQADLRDSLAELYDRLGLADKAREQAETVVATRTALDGPEHPGTLQARFMLCRQLTNGGDFEAAATETRALIKIQQRVFGEDAIETLRSQQHLAVTLTRLTQHEEAGALHRSVVERLSRLFGDDHYDTIHARRSLGAYLAEQRQYTEALAAYQTAHEQLTKTHGPEHFETLDTLAQVAQIYQNTRQVQRALPMLQELSEAFTRQRGADYQRTLMIRFQLANALSVSRRYEEAAEVVDDTLARVRRTLGNDHPLAASVLGAGLRVHLYQGNWERAEQFGQDALQVALRSVGADSSRTLIARSNLALLMLRSGQYQRAVGDATKLLADYQRVLGPTHARTSTTQGLAAKAMMANGNLDRAAHLLHENLIGERGERLSEASRAYFRSLLVTTRVALGRPDDATFMAEILNEWCHEKPSVDGRARGWAWLARGLYASGRYDDARAVLHLSLDLFCETGFYDTYYGCLARVYHFSLLYRETRDAEAAEDARAAYARAQLLAPQLKPEERELMPAELERVLRDAGILN